MNKNRSERTHIIQHHMWLDRFPARPLIKENYPKNTTVLANSTAQFECPIITDLSAHIQWAKYRAHNDSHVATLGMKVQPQHAVYIHSGGGGS